MTERPAEDVNPEDDASEHPVDAAARGAHRGPPVPTRPSRGFTWGLRAVLLAPTALIVIAVHDLAAITAVADTTRTAQVVLVGSTAAIVLVLVLELGLAAGRPRLTDAQGSQLASDLGRDRTRQLRRTLLRREPVPPELRPWGVPYLSTFQSSGPLLGGVGLSFSASGILLTNAKPGSFSPIDGGLLVALAGCAAFTVALRTVAWSKCRRISRS